MVDWRRIAKRSYAVQLHTSNRDRDDEDAARFARKPVSTPEDRRPEQDVSWPPHPAAH
jgi:hypothetical protein